MIVIHRQDGVIRALICRLSAFALSILTLFLTLGIAQAAPSQEFTLIRSEYVRLKNIDPSGEAPSYQDEWTSLASKMQEFMARRPADEDMAQMRLMATETALRLFRRTKRAEYLNAADQSITPLTRATSAQRLAPERHARAWLLAGDTAVCRGQLDAADAWYRLALSGVERRRAAERLQGLRNGTFTRFYPSHDRAAPTIIAGPREPASQQMGPLIVLDPGHGGEDAGAVSPLGGQEKEITLDVAQRAAAHLEKRHGVRVRLTRHKDEFVPLARRTAFANQNGAAVFVSLHVNASAGHDAEGLEVYYLDNTNDEASRKLAERENSVEPGHDVDDIAFMLSDLIQSGKMEDSVLLARRIEGALRSGVVAKTNGFRSLGVKRAPFFVLVGAHMPCSLIEMFFIDNPREAVKLRQGSFRELLAVGIADGIARFLRL